MFSNSCSYQSYFNSHFIGDFFGIFRVGILNKKVLDFLEDYRLKSPGD